MGRKKAQKKEEEEDNATGAAAADDGSAPPGLARTRTMQETSQIAKDYLKRVGHQVHTVLSKNQRSQTRAQYQVRSAVEEMLSDGKKAQPASEDEVEQYKKKLTMVFRLIDINKTGSIDHDQLLSVMRNLGKKPRQEKIQKIFEETDKEKTGKITQASFIEYMLAKRNIKEEDDEVQFQHPNPPAAAPAPAAAEEAASTGRTRKGKQKAAPEPEPQPAQAPLALSVLNRGSSILDFYTDNAGMHEVVEGYEGAEADLGKNNAFHSFSILLMNFNQKAPLKSVFTLANLALQQKGFSVVEISTEEELLDYAPSFDEIWIACSEEAMQQTEKIVAELKKFHAAGKGIGIWAGGDPYFAQANVILKELNGVELTGGYLGEGSLKLVGLGDQAQAPSTLARSLITTGLTDLPQGGIYAEPQNLAAHAQIVARSHKNLPCLVAWEGTSHSGRIFLSCSLVKSLNDENEVAAERRLFSNVAVWLLGLEDRMKLGMRLVGDIQAPNNVTWEYFLEKSQDGKNAGWHPYEENANKIVEAAFQKYVNSTQSDNEIRAFISVHSGNFHYEVDFKTMTQKNTAHPNHKVRKIRRVGDE